MAVEVWESWTDALGQEFREDDYVIYATAQALLKVGQVVRINKFQSDGRPIPRNGATVTIQPLPADVASIPSWRVKQNGKVRNVNIGSPSVSVIKVTSIPSRPDIQLEIDTQGENLKKRIEEIKSKYIEEGAIAQ